ncbi:GNAT family N-acetyltransferase [Marinisporobacter balticus]|uniref:Acetyltransferase (GNAT) family protein n=1 Tax=Marinisporobacter balticus TaxID=2018667 RepID=A0A4R2KU22_9FIRM|nr:GNAT family N-acetyltransferase [Marinisporobacter balticus]TCO73678.1 acetyltransferase (GNAT) family protein [Marinisporobacter balticus]
MNERLHVRLCSLEDEEAYIRLNLDFIKSVRKEHPYWNYLKLPTEEDMKSVFGEALSKKHEIMMFIVEYDKKVIGYANTWSVYSIWSMGRSFIIDDLFIHEDYRGREIGKEVMELLLNYAKNNGYIRIQLNAEKDNIRAHALYKKLNFSHEEMLFFMKVLR